MRSPNEHTATWTPPTSLPGDRLTGLDFELQLGSGDRAWRPPAALVTGLSDALAVSRS